MRYLQRLLSLGHHDAMPDWLARNVRVANAIALLGAVLAVASLPFDVATGPAWFQAWDLVALAGFASCWVLNAAGHTSASRVVMLVSANLVFAYSSAVLGEASRQACVFYALAVAPFLVFDLDEPHLVPMTVLPIALFFASQSVGPLGAKPYSVTAYRIYSPLIAFSALVGTSLVAARVNRRAEAALHDARARAIASARMAALGEMASGIAHEIRNPLTAIGLAADQLAEPANVDVGKLANRITSITTRISKIIDALSSFARDAKDDPFVSAELERIVADTLELCQRRFVAHGIGLTVSPIPQSLVIECRPVQISQVLLNLLNNAHDAVESLAVKWVRLDVHAAADHVELSITDSGPGISKALRERLFEPFFTTKGPDRGTGLGLSLSRGFVAENHGTLDLDEHSPHTRFVLRLPLRQPPTS